MNICKKMMFVVFMIGGLLPQIAGAGAFHGGKLGDCYMRSLSDFLDAQGTQSTFFPPVPDYVGWTDGDFVTFALVDYAGLANEYLGNALGTKVKGRLLECELDSSDRVKIAVFLFAKEALGFAQDIAAIIDNDFDFATTPTVFGNKVVDVESGASAAVGFSRLFMSFTIEKGDSLPDLLDVINNNPAHFAPVELNFGATIRGECADGTRAILRVHQVASTDQGGALVYSKEKVEIVGAGGGSCSTQ